jgi:hypothetical protein
MGRKSKLAALVATALGALALSVGGAIAVTSDGVPESSALVMDISSCNSQLLGDGSTIYWTSAFKQVPYTAGANGQALKIAFKWWRAGGAGTATGVAFRASGFSPSTVTGEFLRLDTDGMLRPNGRTGLVYDADSSIANGTEACNTASVPEGDSSRTKFYFVFRTLHKPGNKPNAKGNAQVNVTVDVAGQNVRLGTNIHVLTAEDQA